MPRGRGYSQGEAPRGFRPHLDVTLKTGCRLDPASGRLMSAEGRAVAATENLPRGSKVVAVVPQLADVDQARLSPAERDLVRRVKILLPRGADPAAVLARVKRWRCVEHAQVGPEISLP
jgi:hypothetical protein